MVLECYYRGYVRAGLALIYHGLETILGWYVVAPLGRVCCALGVHDYEDCFDPNTGAQTAHQRAGRLPSVSTRRRYRHGIVSGATGDR